MASTYHADDIVERLTRRFPPSQSVDLRMALYHRLGRLCEDEELGVQIYLVLATAAADSAGKRDPGRYFAHVVMTRLREHGLLPVDPL